MRAATRWGAGLPGSSRRLWASTARFEGGKGRRGAFAVAVGGHAPSCAGSPARVSWWGEPLFDPDAEPRASTRAQSIISLHQKVQGCHEIFA